LSPDHLFHSQENRFYIAAWLFSSAAMLFGAVAARQQSLSVMCVACGLAVAATLVHTLQGLVSAGLVVAIILSGWARQRRTVTPLAILAMTSTLIAGIIVAVQVMRFGRGWNAGGGWGYGMLHSIMGAVLQIGWPNALLALLGAADVVATRDGEGVYWLTWAGVWAASTVVLPLMVVYHPAYTFPLTLGVFLLAGRAVGKVFELIRIQSLATACVWFGVACLLQAPDIASYYMDGSRYDYRSAAQWVSDNWQPGDRIAAVSPGLLSRYLKAPKPITGLRTTDPFLGDETEAGREGRVWIVVPVGRTGLVPAMRKWLDAHCRRVGLIQQHRYDYYEYAVEIYLRPAGEDSAAKEIR
jgi:hypothetical protein